MGPLLLGQPTIAAGSRIQEQSPAPGDDVALGHKTEGGKLCYRMGESRALKGFLTKNQTSASRKVTGEMAWSKGPMNGRETKLLLLKDNMGLG